MAATKKNTSVYTSRAIDLQPWPMDAGSKFKAPIQHTAALPPLGTIKKDITRKATLTGVTYLKMNSYKTRYPGNKQSAIDANGHLWLDAGVMKKVQQPPSVPGKKEGRVETQPVAKVNSLIPEKLQISCISPIESENLTNIVSSQPGKKIDRTYKVKKGVVRQRIMNYINTQAGRKQLYFFTVTFPMGTPDNTAYKMYNSWLTHLRKYNMLRQYLWVAERQGENSEIGNTTIHFHIAVPHFMNVQKANAMMAGTLKTYVKKGLLNTITVHGCKKYNGVDIAKNRKTKRVINFAIKKGDRALGNYLTKYVTKNDTEFTHLAWHNSRGFSSLFTGVTFTRQEFAKKGYNHSLDFSKQFESEYAIFVPWKNSNAPPEIAHHLFTINSFIQSQLN